MNQQDELARDIRAVDGGHSLGAAELAERLAERGYSRPRVVETITALRALPMGAVVRTPNGLVFQRFHSYWGLTGDPNEFPTQDITLPATVLHLPEETP
ncbi:hypothetical protein [Rhodococcus sp. BE178]|uniref:hypothetical protein n=1 Tax=Rhodococcus sp. BE178 TaxID=2817737 RepID=UPI003D221222